LAISLLVTPAFVGVALHGRRLPMGLALTARVRHSGFDAIA